MNKDILLYFALLLWFVVPVTAQPTIFTPTETVDTGTSIEVDVRVLDFVDIMSMQFSVNWDSLVLQFDSLTNLDALPDYSSNANFNTNSAQQGILTSVWLGDFLNGNTVDDSTVIFTIVFTVIGSSESSTSVAITDNPLSIEFSDVDGNDLSVIVENGLITVATVVGLNPSIESQSNEFFTLYQNEPNPFDNQSLIRFDLRQSNEVSFSFYDTNGKLIYSHKGHFLEGINSIKIDTEKLPGAGTYFYTMKTNNYFLTNKMVLLR